MITLALSELTAGCVTVTWTCELIQYEKLDGREKLMYRIQLCRHNICFMFSICYRTRNKSPNFFLKFLIALTKYCCEFLDISIKLSIIMYLDRFFPSLLNLANQANWISDNRIMVLKYEPNSAVRVKYSDMVTWN